MGQIVAIIGQVRSGTTALQWSLHHSGLLHNFGEIFHISPIESPTNYWGFCASDAEVNKEWFVPTEDARRKCFSRYMSILDASASERIPLIDVKYTMLHHMNLCWHDWFEEPFFLKLLKEAGATIIHLERRNIVAQSISTRIGEHLDRWHYDREGGDAGWLAEKGLELDLSQLEQFVLSTRAIRDLMRRFLGEYDGAITIEYEYLFHNDRVNSAFARELGSKLGVQFGDLVSPLQKTPIHPREIITNLHELEEQIVDLEVKEMFLEAIGSR
jgi:hypothetical protein